VLFVFSYGVRVCVATSTAAATTTTFALWVQGAVFAAFVCFSIRVVARITCVDLNLLFSAGWCFLLAGGHGGNAGNSRGGKRLLWLSVRGVVIFVQLDVFRIAFFSALTTTATSVTRVAAVAAAFFDSGGGCADVGVLRRFQSGLGASRCLTAATACRAAGAFRADFFFLSCLWTIGLATTTSTLASAGIGLAGATLATTRGGLVTFGFGGFGHRLGGFAG